MRLERELPVSAEAAAEARHALDGVRWGLPAGRMQDVRLLISEVVTNSVRHAGIGASGMIRLIVAVDRGHLRVEVRDSGNGFTPRAPRPDPARSSGWGLYLVAELADRWGVETEGATLVWFELDRATAGA